MFAPLLPTLSLGKNSNVSNHLSLNIKVCLRNFKIGQTVCMWMAKITLHRVKITHYTAIHPYFDFHLLILTKWFLNQININKKYYLRAIQEVAIADFQWHKEKLILSEDLNLFSTLCKFQCLENLQCVKITEKQKSFLIISFSANKIDVKL